ncbi:MAG: DHH family phosphoesterase [Anaerolineae bacterium]|nr:DHH family phosphoesterase [Anaerolineae bacterium]
MTEPNWIAAAEAVRQAQTILVVTHIKPDGDAIGTLLGLAVALREMGKTVDAAVDGGPQEFLKFLAGSETIIDDLDRGQWDVMISVDASDEERTGKAGAYGRAHSPLVINLDHHPTNTLFGSIHLIQAQAASAAEVVVEWLEQMRHPLSAPVATALLTGVITDTIGFRTSSVTPRTLEIAQRLMQAGAPLHEIVGRTLATKPYGHIDLWKRVFPTVQLADGIISAIVTPDDIKAAGLTESTDGGLVGILISVEEVAVAVVFKVQSDGTVELSLRSKPAFDVSGMALALGGGGHKQASGATVSGTIDAVREQVMPMLRSVVQQGRAALAS